MLCLLENPAESIPHLQQFIASHDRTYVVEHNASGQLASLLRSAGASADKIDSVLRYDGLPFRAADLVEAIEEGEASR